MAITYITEDDIESFMDWLQVGKEIIVCGEKLKVRHFTDSAIYFDGEFYCNIEEGLSDVVFISDIRFYDQLAVELEE